MLLKNLFLAMSFFSFLAGNAQQQNCPCPQPKTITVTGSAEMEIVPDEIYVQVALREYNKKGVGKIDIETIKKNFLTGCKNIGLSEKEVSVLKNSGYDNNPWWYKKNKKQNPDMIATITYWIKLSKASQVDELVNIMDDEATENFTIAKVSHSKMQEFKKQLKIEAIKAAKEKATYLAEAIDEHIGGAITINDPNEMQDTPRPMYANTMLMKANVANAAPAMDVDFKKMKIQYEVTVVFALK